MTDEPESWAPGWSGNAVGGICTAQPIMKVGALGRVHVGNVHLQYGRSK